MSNVKEQDRAIVEQLPAEASWDDLMHRIYVRQKIAAGLEDVEQGRTILHEDVTRRFLAQ